MSEGLPYIDELQAAKNSAENAHKTAEYWRTNYRKLAAENVQLRTDAECWRRLPAFAEKYQLDLLGLMRDCSGQQRTIGEFLRDLDDDAECKADLGREKAARLQTDNERLRKALDEIASDAQQLQAAKIRMAELWETIPSVPHAQPGSYERGRLTGTSEALLAIQHAMEKAQCQDR